ncbi:MAG TPA: DUF6526 family protein [Terracidiphilus sp.]|jgi:hypothetical protein
MSKTKKPQDFKHHARLHPPFHIVSISVLVANLVITTTHMVKHFDFWNTWIVVLSVIVFFPFFLIRIYPLKVQDRVIRLEERIRLQALAPAEWHTQIFRLTEDQLIALRFASDDEVVALAKQALEERLTRKQIKERIKSWRPDYWRV